MKGGHGQANQLHDINWCALDHASCAPQLMSCNYMCVYTCVCVCVCVCVYSLSLDPQTEPSLLVPAESDQDIKRALLYNLILVSKTL